VRQKRCRLFGFVHRTLIDESVGFGAPNPCGWRPGSVSRGELPDGGGADVLFTLMSRIAHKGAESSHSFSNLAHG